MRGGFRMRKKYLQQAGWQVVGENKEGKGEYKLILEKADGDQMTIKGSSRARAFVWAEQELLRKK